MDQKSIPYFAHEGMMVRMERTIKRLWIALIIVAAMLSPSCTCLSDDTRM